MPTLVTGWPRQPDVAAVALEGRQQSERYFPVYRELAAEAEAAEWFGIVPADRQTDNVLRFAS